MRLCLVVGTRPEIIKMSPVMRECLDRDVEFFILHTGQHYSYNMDALFFQELNLPNPDYSLAVGSGSFSTQISRMLTGIAEALEVDTTTFVLGQGDTNTVLASALVASNMQIPFVHVEAGLRSYNQMMQEEKNRIIADRVAEILFPPTEIARDILIREGRTEDQMLVTGNTIVDAVHHYLPIAREKRSVTSFGLEPQKYFLATVHRAENTDFREVLQQIFVGLEEVSRVYDRPIAFPIHPRTRGRIKEFGISTPECIRMMEPVGFYDFLVLESDAALVFTDSGGVQEECCILQVPCVTLRDDTERPETVAAGGNILAGRVSTELLKNTNDMLSRPRDWANPFGDGKAASRIIDFLLESPLNKVAGGK